MPMIANNETYLSTEETLQYLGVTRQTLNKYVRRGKLQQYKPGIGRTVYYKQAELEQLKAMHRIEDETE